MECWLKAPDLLVISADSLPQYKKRGSIVRNNYFWALQSIACYAKRDQDWEFDQLVWLALARMLTFFLDSGYLYTSETLLEFPPDSQIPDELKAVATWQSPEDAETLSTDD